jgi:phage gpG-like protein
MSTPRSAAQLSAEFARMAERIGGASVEHRKAAPAIIRADIRTNFQTSSDPDGKPWPPLKRARANGSSTPLVKSRELLRSATTPGHPNHVERDEGGTLVIGTKAVQANLQNHGGVVRPRRARFLTIPVSREADRTKGGARNFARKLFPVVKGGKPVALAEGKRRRGLVVHYLLRKFVVIPARRFVGYGKRLVGKLSDDFHRRVIRSQTGRPT